MMKGGASFKSVLVMVILLLVGVLGVLFMNTAKTYLSGAAADTEPKNVIAKPLEDGKSASVSWTSDKPTTGVVEYGTTPASLLLRALESEATANHAVVLKPLKMNTNYYFRIRVGEEVYDNNGIPYSFKTKGSGQVESPTKAAPPSVVTATEPKCKSNVDYNKDGVINTVDLILCNKGQITSVPVTTPVVSGAPCQSNVDYDGNGVVNSLDRIKCLQKGGR